VPGPPFQPVVSDITSTSCRLTFEPSQIQDDDPPVSGYYVECRLYGVGHWSRVNRRPITRREATMNRLHPGVEYEFRVAALNDNGLGEFSESFSVIAACKVNRLSQQIRDAWSRCDFWVSSYFVCIRLCAVKICSDLQKNSPC